MRLVGMAVRMSAQRLRDQYLPEGTMSSYTRVIVDGNLAGNAFACRWMHNGKTICWVTQLVVHKAYRERGLARSLLTSLRQDTDDIFGVISSHPFACLAAARSYGSMSIPPLPMLLRSGANHFKGGLNESRLTSSENMPKKSSQPRRFHTLETLSCVAAFLNQLRRAWSQASIPTSLSIMRSRSRLSKTFERS